MLEAQIFMLDKHKDLVPPQPAWRSAIGGILYYGIITGSLSTDYSCARFSDYTLYGIITGSLSTDYSCADISFVILIPFVLFYPIPFALLDRK